MADEWTLSGDEVEAFTEESHNVCRVAAVREPRFSDWGVCAYSDASPAMGGGFCHFLWFPDRSSLLDFVKRLLVFLNPGPVSHDPGLVLKKTKAIVADIERGVIEMRVAEVRLNKALKEFSQI